MRGEPENTPQNPKTPDQSGSGQSQPIDVVPPDVQQQAAQLAAQQAIQKMPANFLQMAFSATPMANPLFAKIEPQHITQILTISSNHDEREFKTNQRGQLFIFLSFLATVGLVVLLILVFQQKPEVLGPLLAGLVGLGSGFAAGFGVGRRQK